MVLLSSLLVFIVLPGLVGLDKAGIFLDVAHNLKLRSGVEGVARPAQQLHQMRCYIATAQVHSLGGVRYGVALVDGTGVSHAVTTVQHHTGCQPTCIERENSLSLEEQVRNAEGFKELFCSFDPVANWVVRWLCQQHAVFSWVDLELIEDVAPDGLHLFPVSDDAVLHWVVELDNPLVFVRLMADKVFIIVQRVDHDLLVLRSTHSATSQLTIALTMSETQVKVYPLRQAPPS